MVGKVPNIITYAKFQIEIYKGYNFTWGRIFDFPIDFYLDRTTVCDDRVTESQNFLYSQWRIAGILKLFWPQLFNRLI